MAEPDIAFDALKQSEDIIRGAAGSNEATTRLRAIDTVLFDVLCWNKLLVENEKYCRAEGYADYVFKQGETPCLVLEAKKSDATFLLPNRKYGSHPFGFGLLAKECVEAHDALIQAAGYAASLGCRYVGITNGHQWILALTFVQGQAIDRRSVFVFESFDAIIERFSVFFDCFSPEGVYGNLAASQLLESRKARAPEKLSRRIRNYPVPADRNVILNELDAVLGLVWDEMSGGEDEDTFLQECYVRPEASEDAITQATELLRQRYETDLRAQGAAYDAREIGQIVGHDAPEKPILDLGRSGHGKSTFLKYLRRIEARELFDGYVQIDIDFLDQPESRGDVSQYIYSQIDAQLYGRYNVDIRDDGVVRSALRPDLARFRRSPEGKAYASDEKAFVNAELELMRELRADRHGYLTKVFGDLKRGRKKAVGVFFDNLDRRTDDIQEEAFLIASAIARDWECLVFVCLRPGTFYRSKGEGILDSVAPKTLVIVSPKTGVLLKKRFAYARSIAEGENAGPQRRAPLGAAVTYQLPKAAELLGVCERSFLKNKRLASLFEAVSNGNVRDMLHYVHRVLTSQHFNTKKILEKIPLTGYTLAEHEALRALLYGDSIHYDPNSSVFINVFDIARADPQEHFSRLLALHCLDGVPAGAPSYGLCGIDDILEYLCQLGFSREHAVETLQFLYAKQCCEGRVPGLEWTEADNTLRLTPLGAYHVNELVRTFQYYDAIAVDTPILDDSSRDKVCDVMPIRDRLDRAEVLMGYLRHCAQSLQDAEGMRFCLKILSDAERDVAEVRRRVAEQISE